MEFTVLPTTNLILLICGTFLSKTWWNTHGLVEWWQLCFLPDQNRKVVQCLHFCPAGTYGPGSQLDTPWTCSSTNTNKILDSCINWTHFLRLQLKAYCIVSMQQLVTKVHPRYICLHINLCYHILHPVRKIFQVPLSVIMDAKIPPLFQRFSWRNYLFMIVWSATEIINVASRRVLSSILQVLKFYFTYLHWKARSHSDLQIPDSILHTSFDRYICIMTQKYLNYNNKLSHHC